MHKVLLRLVRQLVKAYLIVDYSFTMSHGYSFFNRNCYFALITRLVKLWATFKAHVSITVKLAGEVASVDVEFFLADNAPLDLFMHKMSIIRLSTFAMSLNIFVDAHLMA